MRFSHADRKARRTSIVEALKAQEPAEQIAARMGLTANYVRTIGRGAGIVFKSPEQRTAVIADLSVTRFVSYRVIAALCNTDKTLSEIGAEAGVTRQRISQIYLECVKVGIPVRPRLQGQSKSEKEPT